MNDIFILALIVVGMGFMLVGVAIRDMLNGVDEYRTHFMAGVGAMCLSSGVAIIIAIVYMDDRLWTSLF